MATKLQYDYFAAYLNMYADMSQREQAGDRGPLRPSIRWTAGRSNAFAVIGQQMEEAPRQGGRPRWSMRQNRDQQQGHLAATEATLRSHAGGPEGQLLSWQNLPAVQVNYYLMDVELLFSRNPFVQQSSASQFALDPNRMLRRK